MNKELIQFKDKNIRRTWYNEEWYFSVVDIITVLTDSIDAGAYWRKLKQRLNEENSQVVTNCHGLKLIAQDGKMRETDCANTESIFRIIQSVPSPKAEPFKQWLARVGHERVQEIQDPEMSLNRAKENWESLGRDKNWIKQRMLGQQIRNNLTDYWKDSNVKEGKEYAILTDIIHREWSGLKTKEHKELKELKKENLRDHMSEAELLFTALAELWTKEIAEKDKADGFKENAISAKKGGKVAQKARLELENETGNKVISADNYKNKSIEVEDKS